VVIDHNVNIDVLAHVSVPATCLCDLRVLHSVSLSVLLSALLFAGGGHCSV
jgi:hypothetical protein